MGKKALLIRLSSLGDILFNIPLANILKDNGYEVGWVVSEKGYEIIKDNPCVDKTYLAPVQRWKKRGLSLVSFFEYLQILKEIRKERYDVAIDLQQMFKSMYWMIGSGAKRRITTQWAKEFSHLGANEIFKTAHEGFNLHSVINNLKFAQYLGLNTDKIKFTLPETSQKAKSHIDELTKEVDKSKPIAVIAPATTWELKHWNKDNWKTVIENIKNNYSLIFTGTDADKELLTYIGADNFTNLCGKTNLEELRELFSRVDLVIAPDSGSAHLAWASNKPAVIAIFTCTPPGLFGPFNYTDEEKYFAVNGELKCQPCFTRDCPLADERKNLCTKIPDAQKIINIVNKLLKIAK